MPKHGKQARVTRFPKLTLETFFLLRRKKEQKGLEEELFKAKN